MNLNNQPLVSIIVPSYNHERFVVECIESIQKQTYRQFELIVIDDGSKDNSREILTRLQSIYGFTLVFQENHGAVYTLKRGLNEFASGKYLTFCASDDYWPIDKLEKQVMFMENNQFYPMCYGKTIYVNESSEVIHEYTFLNNTLKGGWLFDDILLFKIQPPVNYMFSKNIFDEIELFDYKVFAEDYYMNLKISEKYPIGFIDEFLSYYRINDFSGKAKRNQTLIDSHLRTIEQYKHHKLYKEAKATVYLQSFDLTSIYKNLKLYALKMMIKSIKLFYKQKFIRAFVKMFYYWR